MSTQYYKLVSFYIVSFLILYMEPIEIAGGLTFGIIWKLILMLFLFFPVLYNILRDKRMEMLAIFSILFALKLLLSYTSMDAIMKTMTLLTKEMMFPLLFLYFTIKVKKSETLIFIVKHFSIVIILSFVPYMLGILEPFAEGYDLAEFGHIGQYGLIGPFIKPHSGAITLSLSMIMVTTYVKKENSLNENIIYIAFLILGFYELINTYVRTGIMIYMVSLLYMYLKDIDFKKIVLLIMTAFTIFGVGVYMYQTNDVFRMRFEDKNKYNGDKGGSGGSGRLIFWKNAVENWLDDDDSVILIGLGYDYSREKMYHDTGMLIFAHNRFLQVLQQEGLIGFGLFLTYLILVYQFILRYKDSQYYTATNAIFIGILIEMMFQGGFFFNIVLYLSAYLVILKKDYENNQIVRTVQIVK